MGYRPLLVLADEGWYRRAFEATYSDCSPLQTHDGMQVRFYPSDFDHAFFCDTDRHGNAIPPVFDRERGEHLHWIAACLSDPTLSSYRRVMENGDVRRLILVPSEPYLVVLRGVIGPASRFCTAYVVKSASALSRIQGNPPW